MIPTCIVTNERVAWFGRWKFGTFIMVAVAATNVGDIETHFDADISTNNIENRVESEKVYDKPLNFSRGDDFGTFIMVAVAATNVGDIETHFDADISTNNIENRVESEKFYDKPLNFSRGDDFGHFNF